MGVLNRIESFSSLANRPLLLEAMYLASKTVWHVLVFGLDVYVLGLGDQVLGLGLGLESQVL